jgi:hypothetical protein
MFLSRDIANHFKINIFVGKAVQRGSTVKTAVFDHQSTQIFFSRKPTYVLQKKYFQSNFALESISGNKKKPEDKAVFFSKINNRKDQKCFISGQRGWWPFFKIYINVSSSCA